MTGREFEVQASRKAQPRPFENVSICIKTVVNEDNYDVKTIGNELANYTEFCVQNWMDVLEKLRLARLARETVESQSHSMDQWRKVVAGE